MGIYHGLKFLFKELDFHIFILLKHFTDIIMYVRHITV